VRGLQPSYLGRGTFRAKAERRNRESEFINQTGSNCSVSSEGRMTDITTDFIVTEPTVAERVSAARQKLVTPTPRQASSMKALGAAALAAFTALMLAAAVIMGPGMEANAPTVPSLSTAHVSGR